MATAVVLSACSTAAARLSSHRPSQQRVAKQSLRAVQQRRAMSVQAAGGCWHVGACGRRQWRQGQPVCSLGSTLTARFWRSRCARFSQPNTST